jgi:alpha-D-ribose 1-methylphosphonate 5-triphosphate synthase subunit PhnH
VTVPVLTPRGEREQRTFRALLDCMARPGSLRTLPDTDNPLLAIAESLVDHEVTFAVLPQGAPLSEAILRMTGSRVVAPELADYLFCDGESLVDAVRLAKDGTPEYPDAGATLICGVRSLSADVHRDGSTDGQVGRDSVSLSGPGVRQTKRVGVDGFTSEARQVFAQRNAWPPLGLDLVLVAPDGTVVCLNRYTRLQGD